MKPLNRNIDLCKYFTVCILLWCVTMTINSVSSQDSSENSLRLDDSIRDQYFNLFVPQSTTEDESVEEEKEDSESETDSTTTETPTPTITRITEDLTPQTDTLEKYREGLNDIAKKCPRTALYCSFNPDHRSAVYTLASLHNDTTDLRGFFNLSSQFRQEVHPVVWFAGFFRAKLEMMPNILLSLDAVRPSLIESFPSRFFPMAALEQDNSTNSTSNQCSIVDENFGKDNGIENRLWYFREDVQMNSHHWIWHLLNPANSNATVDRRGESFSFFHHELIARYTTERIANALEETEPLHFDLNTIVEEGYNSHLVDGISTRTWGVRPSFQQFRDRLDDTTFRLLYNATLIRNRIVHSLHTGALYKANGYLPISETDNIDLVADITEASVKSINRDYYHMSGLHNLGHRILMTLVGNSTGTLGPMGDSTTAMRDTVFYRWHKFVDILFQSYKATHLAPYKLYDGDYPLIFEGIRVSDVNVVPDAGRRLNNVYTFWNTRRFDLDGGLDFGTVFAPNTSKINVSVCTKHLDHEDFSYKINIENSHRGSTPATVRIFLAPRFKSLKRGKRRFTLAEQRGLFFTMDVFMTVLKPGENIISRKSANSSLTAPWPRSVEELRKDMAANINRRIDCECGFPQHLLLPKGTKKGMVFDLFVMVTNATEDKVSEPAPPTQDPNFPECTPAYIHCGIPGRKYPDSKPMGYPFDRKPFSVPRCTVGKFGKRKLQNLEVEILDEYISYVPNMATTQIVITHKNVNVGRENQNNV